jgi:hypothetical protein
LLPNKLNPVTPWADSLKAVFTLWAINALFANSNVFFFASFAKPSWSVAAM